MTQLSKQQTDVLDWARKDWQVEQEKNLCYVAVTSAKKELVKVSV